MAENYTQYNYINLNRNIEYYNNFNYSMCQTIMQRHLNIDLVSNLFS